MSLLHYVDTLYGGLGGNRRTGRRVDCGGTASLAGARGTRRRRRSEAFHCDMTPFSGREFLAQVVQVFGVAEIEVGLGQRSALDQLTVSRLIARD